MSWEGLTSLFLILPQGDLGVDFVRKVERDLDRDEERGAAEHKRGDTREPLDDRRRDRDEAEEEGAGKRDAIHDLADILFCFATGAHARDEGTGLLKILCNAMWLKRDSRVEIGEEHHKEEVDRAVLPRIREKCGVPN